MKRKLTYLVVVASVLLFLACSGLPGKFFGVGSLPSAYGPEAGEATFHFRLIAQDKEPDEDNYADTFRGAIRYTDQAAGVDIRGVVADALDEGFADEEMGGVYYDEDFGEYGAFGGYWTMQSPSDFPVTEGIFVVRVLDDPTGEEGGDGIRIELFDLEADIFLDPPPLL